MKRATVLSLNLALLLVLPGLAVAQQASQPQGQPQTQGQSQGQLQGQNQGQNRGQGQGQGQAQGQEQMQSRNQGQMRDQGGQPMAGSGLMTPEEQEQLKERVRSAGSQEERQAILDDHRLKMADRARAQGMNPESIEGLPSSSGDDPRSRQIQGQPTGAPQGGASGPASAAGQGTGMNTGPGTGTGRGPQQPVPGQQDRAGGVR